MTTFALIPGAGSDQWYWSRLVPLLTDRGHEALAPEMPVDVARIALLCPMIPAPGDTGNDWWKAAGQDTSARAAAEREGRDPDAPFDLETTFLHDVPPDVTAELLARPEPAQEDRLFEEPWPLAAWPDVPTTVLAGTRDRLFPLDLVQRLSRERLGLDHVDTVDSGHLAALARPGEVAAWLDR
jgi:pimeloyl-ACP methyl ester carboxylesterase